MWYNSTLFFFVTAEDHHDCADSEEDVEIQLEMVEMTLGTLDLRESEIQPSRHRRRRRKKEPKKDDQGGSNLV